MSDKDEEQKPADKPPTKPPPPPRPAPDNEIETNSAKPPKPPTKPPGSEERSTANASSFRRRWCYPAPAG
jgi:hypothetical protein